ncbi:hypothetical protein [Actinomadura sp. BRA 177]|uniref:hypothetical protein n=1 Tax=Actinomadura sp. BRA 177 TaxID=2745202 RepID=UPI001595A207|nr:hypothetical protein [Actinomadura sp. BRA 177]NVI91153.1 hypothetical protein [Actinomadura sp. BRA 177]
MNNRTRWTIVAILIAINAVSNAALGDTWLAIAVSALTGLPAIALVIDYFVRARRT